MCGGMPFPGTETDQVPEIWCLKLPEQWKNVKCVSVVEKSKKCINKMFFSTYIADTKYTEKSSYQTR